MFKTKIFFGTSKFGRGADKMFNEWIEEHPSIEIIKFKYQEGVKFSVSMGKILL